MDVPEDIVRIAKIAFGHTGDWEPEPEDEPCIERIARALLAQDKAATERERAACATLASSFLTTKEALLEVEYIVNDEHGGDATVEDFVPIITARLTRAIRSQP